MEKKFAHKKITDATAKKKFEKVKDVWFESWFLFLFLFLFIYFLMVWIQKLAVSPSIASHDQSDIIKREEIHLSKTMRTFRYMNISNFAF